MGLIGDALARDTESGCPALDKLDDLSVEDRADFDAYVEALRGRFASPNPTNSNGPSLNKLRGYLIQLGVTIGRESLSEHIQGKCGCGSDR